MESNTVRYVAMAAFAALVAIAVAHARVAAAAPFAYVAGRTQAQVQRVDLATNESTLIDVGQSPMGVGSDASGDRVVIGNSDGQSVTIIDGAAGVAIGSIPVVAHPFGVGMNAAGTKAYAADSYDGGVHVIDTVLGDVIKVIQSNGSLGSMAMSPNRERAYVTKNGFPITSLFVVDTTTDTAVADIFLSDDQNAFAGGAAVADDFIYVGMNTGIAIVDAATNLLVGEVPVPECDSGCEFRDLTVTPDGSTVYAGLFSGPGGTVALDTATRDYVLIPTSAEFSSVTGVDVTPDGSRLYVLTSGLVGVIDIIDTSSHTLVGSLLTLVYDPHAIGEFIAGSDEPPAPTTPPVLNEAARTCQKALLDSFKPYGAKAHQLFSGCLRKLQVDHAAGAIKPATISSCKGDLDPADPTSKLSRARTTARQKALARCTGVTPAALGSPCDESAATIGDTADCMLGSQLNGVAAILPDTVAQACGLLALAGVEDSLPGCVAP
jgi:DNA-binding beta-propeller fold protein YncE